MRTMKHLLLKTSTRRSLIRTLRSTRKPIHGKTNPKPANKPEARIIPISRAGQAVYSSPYVSHDGDEASSSETSVRIIRLLASFPQIA